MSFSKTIQRKIRLKSTFLVTKWELKYKCCFLFHQNMHYPCVKIMNLKDKLVNIIEITSQRTTVMIPKRLAVKGLIGI